MKIELEIPDEEMKEALTCVIAKALYNGYSSDSNRYKRIIQECVREVIYKDKENIINRVVSQASRECKSKAVKKLIEGLED